MTRTAEWKIRLYLFEEDNTTKARVVLDTGTAVLTGHGVARCNAEDRDVPEIGDELAAGRALHDLDRQLMTTAHGDMEALQTTQSGPGTTRGAP
ncbi:MULTISPECIES: DUF1876 domain-containing protein [Streptomyces]|uniref:DUF1876 domain-containing protein n=1 Tax=Streptomyces pratisoli TaxID=3139917 RepID=A0ACC6QB58_9ACTN|nr:DUF1876 domain-containing protein [Streptomyces sp. NBC_00259]